MRARSSVKVGEKIRRLKGRALLDVRFWSEPADRGLTVEENAVSEVRGLTLSDFQDHLHAFRGAHSPSHAVQALARPVRRGWRDKNTKVLV